MLFVVEERLEGLKYNIDLGDEVGLHWGGQILMRFVNIWDRAQNFVCAYSDILKDFSQNTLSLPP